ncbi:MAG: adenylate kinase [Lachnospiraceae bacterium]|nr:adenylate kinase [Lachnospiraceae bacterium]
MNLIFLGAPGAGKGTAATKLSEILGIPHISTGDIFRANIHNGTELGKLAEQYISKGHLVPDDVTIGMVKARLSETDCAQGFILDGFPRTIAQAEALDKFLEESGRKIDRTVDIVLSETRLVERLVDRRVCVACKLSFNLKTHKIADNSCPVCGASLMMRDDDRPEVIAARLAAYHKDTEPLIEYYVRTRKLVRVNSEEKISDTFANILAALELRGMQQ